MVGYSDNDAEELTRVFCVCWWTVAAKGQEKSGAAGQVPGLAGNWKIVQVHGQKAQEKRQQGSQMAAHTAEIGMCGLTIV